MKLHEHQSKSIFARYGIPIPSGKLANTPQEVRQHAQALGGRVVIKAQVLAGGRGKAGGIRLANSPEEAEHVAAQMLGETLKGIPITTVLVEDAVDIEKELYLGITIDRTARKVVIMASVEGGVEIEEVARKAPEKIVRVLVDPCIGLRDYQARQLAIGIGLPRHLWRQFLAIVLSLYSAFMNSDASLAEINPLVVTSRDKLLAVDGKMVLDENALFRHDDLSRLRDVREEDELELRARQQGISYIRLDGNIGCMVNGAGLAMATMDIIQLLGGTPANFLDIGGGAQADKVASALNIILGDDNVQVVLFNIFGGITRCDEVAKGILSALPSAHHSVAMVARLVGTNELEGQKLLDEAGISTATTLYKAAQKAVELARI